MSEDYERPKMPSPTVELRTTFSRRIFQALMGGGPAALLPGPRTPFPVGFQRVLRKGQILHYPSADEMFLNNALQGGRSAGMVPNTLRVNEGDGSLRANAQAVGFRAIHQSVRPDQPEFLKAPLEKPPRRRALFLRAAFGLGLLRAKEYMALEFFQSP